MDNKLMHSVLSGISFKSGLLSTRQSIRSGPNADLSTLWLLWPAPNYRPYSTRSLHTISSEGHAGIINTTSKVADPHHSLNSIGSSSIRYSLSNQREEDIFMIASALVSPITQGQP
ncbi:hypothetical protein PPYR_07190 [Photinus pyralis]|uniref:Uncharacterized protein n=1 Tax=Photinus pyralis TaxID=7054 RepID=A0A5N4APP5_PHOPY|nr:hypothetical protein PPYR_07190 [Photinus pyralis]